MELLGDELLVDDLYDVADQVKDAGQTIGQRLTDGLNSTLSRAGDTLTNVGGKLKSFGGGLTRIATGGLVAATGGILALTAATTSYAAEVSTVQRNLQAEIGVTEDVAERLGDVAERVYGENFGDDVIDAANTVATAYKLIGDEGDEALQRVSEQAFAIRDVFNEDINESLSAARTLMDNFGLSSDQAMDFIVSGFQRGLNRSGDFLDTINEYSVQFNNAGATAGEFFSLLETGVQGGNLGTDKIADLFKEFTLRIQDDSDKTVDALAAIGISYEDLNSRINSGEITQTHAFETVIEQLYDMEDQAAAALVATDLLGTQFEDLGMDALLGVYTTTTAMEDLAGAADSLNDKYGSMGDFVSGVFRRLQIKTRPFGETILELANTHAPAIHDAIDALEPGIDRVSESLGEMLDQFLTTFSPKIETAIAKLPDFIERSVERILGIISFISDNPQIAKIGAMVAGLIAVAGPVLLVVGNIVTAVGTLISMAGGLSAVTGALGAIVTFLTGPVGWGIAAAIAGVVLLRQAWVNNWGDIQGKTAEAWAAIQALLQQAGDYITNTVIPAVQQLWQRWVNEWWPQIVQAAVAAWDAIRPVLIGIGNYILNTIIPTLVNLYTQWTTVWWPQIAQAIRNTGVIINTILAEVFRWVNDNIVPIMDHLWLQWTTVWWPQIQEVLLAVWEVIQPILQAVWSWLAEKITPAMQLAHDAMVNGWNAIKTAVSSAWVVMEPIFTRIKDFWSWLSSADFSFDFQIPDLPSWLLPGSPIPLHTRWKDFARFLDSTRFEPAFAMPGSNMMADLAGMQAGMSLASSAQMQQNSYIDSSRPTYNIYGSNRQIRSQIEADRAERMRRTARNGRG